MHTLFLKLQTEKRRDVSRSQIYSVRVTVLPGVLPGLGREESWKDRKWQRTEVKAKPERLPWMTVLT